MILDDYFPWNNWFVNLWLFEVKSDRWFFPSNIGSENWWFTTNDLFQFLIFAMIVTIKPFKDDQSFSGDGIDRSQSSHWNLQICTLTLSGIFVTKNWKKDIGNNFLKVLQYLLWQRIAKNTQNKILDIMVTKKNGNKQNPWISLRGMCPPPRRPDASQDYPSGWIIIPFFHQKPNELRNYLVRFLAKRCLRWCMIVTLCMSQQQPEKSGFLWKPG